LNGYARRRMHWADTGGSTDRGPDWIFGLKGEESCGDVECWDRQETVGLFLKSGS
jgi:hypothetical protein